jgi:O-antigen ligase
MASTRSTTRPDHAGGRGKRTDWNALAWASLPVGLIFLAHVWFGANSSFAALTLAAAEALVLMVLCTRREAKEALVRAGRLPWIAGLFLLTLLAVGWSLTSMAPGGAHPIWSYVTTPGSVTIDRSSTAIELAKLVGLGCAFLTGMILGGSDRLFRAGRAVLAVAGGAFALWALLLFVGGGQLKGGRLMGAFGSANAAATVLAVLILLALPWLFNRPSNAKRPAVERLTMHLPVIGLLVLLAGAFLLTASRWGFISLVAALLAFVAVQISGGRMKPAHAIAFAGGLMVAGALLLLLKGGLLVERLGDTVLDADARTTMLAVHWPLFLQSPLFGYGLGTFPGFNQLILDARNYLVLGDIRDLHNVYVQWLEEGGVVAAVPMFLTVAAIVGFAILDSRGRQRIQTWIAALIAADVMVLVHGLSDFALQVPSIAAFWSLLLGLQLGLTLRQPHQSAGRG